MCISLECIHFAKNDTRTFQCHVQPVLSYKSLSGNEDTRTEVIISKYSLICRYEEGIGQNQVPSILSPDEESVLQKTGEDERGPVPVWKQ